jgi:DNA-binding MarR family transcriptional regulator
MAVARTDDPGLGSDEHGAWRWFARAHDLLHRELDARLEQSHGLQLKSFDVLSELAASSDRRMRMSELAERVSMSRSGLSRLVDRLATDGLIQRSPCPEDARGSFAVLTARGLRRLVEATPAYEEAIHKSFLAHFDPVDLDRLTEYCARLLTSAKT